jgi:predicted RNase H-like nuclease (RuvC/YqgF family)
MERTARLTLEAQINHLTAENENLRKKLDDAKRDIDSLHVRYISSEALYILNMFLFGTES